MISYTTVDARVEQLIAAAGVAVALVDVPPEKEDDAPWAIIYPLFGQQDETALMTNSYRDLTYQVTCVGATPQQARWAQEKVQAALLTSAAWGSGNICGINLMSGGMVTREDEVTYSAVDTYEVKASDS